MYDILDMVSLVFWRLSPLMDVDGCLRRGNSWLWTQTALCLQQVLISSADVLSLSWALSLSGRFRDQAGW